VIELENHPELLIPERISVTRSEAIDALAVEGDLSSIGAIERAEQMQEGTFARTTLADDRSDPAFGSHKVDPLEYRDGGFVSTVRFE
jgi:hypothetical protein